MKRKIIVQKYGGSSVADIDLLQRVAARIERTRQAGYGLVVVVSAMGNTTNSLIQLARSVSEQPDRRELDMLMSVGERISMSLLAMALVERGIPAVSLTGSQSGIITDEAHADARVVEVRVQRIQQCLERGQVVIVAGFQGVSREREITTLGRGGSDTTAVILAAALDAEYCEICTDVDGVWSADPRKVDNAHRIDVMSLDEGLTLARGGARVIAEDAMRFAKDSGVVLHVSATQGPGSGTRLSTQQVARSGPVAVTSDTALFAARVQGEPKGLNEAMQAVGARLRRRINDRLQIDVRNVHSPLSELSFEGVQMIAPTAVVTLVGGGLEADGEVATKAQTLVAGKVSVRSQLVQGDVMWWELDPQQVDEVVGLLHHAFIAASQ
jgi:aspartate kinase